MKTLTFKDIQDDLKASHLVITSEVDVPNYDDRLAVLQSMGLQESYTARLYDQLITNSRYINEVYDRYHRQHKIITLPQLEKVCTKYNLWEVNTKDYIGTIPERNVDVISNFKIHFYDLPTLFQLHLYEVSCDHKHRIFDGTFMHNIPRSFCPHEEQERDRVIRQIIPFRDFSDYWVEPNILRTRYGLPSHKLFSICSVKSLVMPSSVKDRTERLLDYGTLAPPVNDIDLDPIFLFRLQDNVKLIVTAWGEEARDINIINPSSN